MPCDPQSAVAGSNIRPRPLVLVRDLREVALSVRSRAIGPGESGQGRKAAAVSRSPDVPRGSLTGANWLSVPPGAEVEADACRDDILCRHTSLKKNPDRTGG